ncbi:MAG: helix-turn-helix transcriptional regulator, partial [Acidimicrobiales bacterium]
GLEPDDVVRDLQLVGLCGMPPYGGGDLVDVWVDDEGVVHAYRGPFFARPMQLTPAEGFAVLAAGRGLLAVPGADRTGSLARALVRLEAALGPGAVAVDLAAVTHLSLVRDATDRHERLEVGYYSAWRDEVTERRIDPYLLHAADGHWYLEAHCHRAGDLRRFRVDRLEWVRPTGITFEARELPSPTELFSPGPEAALLTLEVPATARWAVEAAPVASLEERPGGRLRVTLPVAGTAFVERLLLRLGPDAEVLGPPDLADIGRRAAARLLARYEP